MLSQTGYGKGESQTELGSCQLEIKAVNGKFLDITLKAPRQIAAIEEQIKKEIQKVATRGTVEVRISLNLNQKPELMLNSQLVAAYKAAAGGLKKLGIKNDLKASKLLFAPDVLSFAEKSIDSKELWQLVLPSLKAALKMFVSFKQKEGKNMQADLAQMGEQISKELAEVKKRVPKMLKENQDKMRTRIKELLGSTELDEAKMANEIAFFVDRVDINEEIKRLESHLGQYAELLKETAPGKQIEFLSQEMTREINTMGSKSNDIEITKHVLAMKNANEKIKEQMRNIE